MSLSIIIPLKNEDEIIIDTLQFLERSWIKDINHEIILIDDFSSDNTWNLISRYQNKALNIKSFEQNNWFGICDKYGD